MAEFPAQDLVLLGVALVLVDVRAGPHPANDRSVGSTHRKCPAKRPAIFAAMMPKPIFDFVRLAGRKAMPPQLPGPLLVVRMEHVVPPCPVGRAMLDPGELVPAGVVII